MNYILFFFVILLLHVAKTEDYTYSNGSILFSNGVMYHKYGRIQGWYDEMPIWLPAPNSYYTSDGAVCVFGHNSIIAHPKGKGWVALMAPCCLAPPHYSTCGLNLNTWHQDFENGNKNWWKQYDYDTVFSNDL